MRLVAWLLYAIFEIIIQVVFRIWLCIPVLYWAGHIFFAWIHSIQSGINLQKIPTHHCDLLFLGLTQFWGNPNQSINIFFWGFPLYQVATESGCHSVFLGYFSVLDKNNLSSHNCEIFHNFNVGLFLIHPGQFGTHWSLTAMWIEWCDSN